MLDLALVGLRPGAQLLGAHALVAQLCEAVDEHAVARARGERVDDDDLAVGVLLGKEALCGGGGVIRAGDAARERYVHHVEACGQELLEVLEVVSGRDLRGLRVGPGEHPGIEVRGGDALAEVVLVGLAAELIVKE